MQAIYASKMFRSSKRKSRIISAMENPINVELVQQLREYLDDEYITESYLEPEQDIEPVIEDEVEETADSTVNHSVSSVESEASGEVEEVKEVDDTAGEVGESTSVSKSKIMSQTVLYSSNILVSDIPDAVEQIKGTLNSRADTDGVNRILCRDGELWIYYNDKINLNNVMGSVVELLNASGYTYLDFNRLARSDNAIVFQVSFADTNTEIDPIGGDKDGESE